LTVRIAVGVAFLTAWACIEEWGIDRYGVWKYLPYYRKGDACVWDLTVTLIIIGTVWYFSREPRDRTRE
jgi:hypothetical protein